MVLRIGGWVLTYRQVRTWLELGGQDTKNLKPYELSGALDDWFKERKIEDMTPIPTDYPHGTKKPVVILATRYYQDPAATVTHYTLFVEKGDKTDRDTAVEKEDKGGGVEKEDGDKEE
ncbi:hypothetical protein SCP_0412830 [Sparassis crispa]|uniref:Uncharacterized protein n=1 Tax=Sparassis crispa TaxID=139825 RepID=A0A401GL56_9APHY|nr:hypothetical protein SCP_0412830 [Sparassis crispa]GBE82896.1 hypothetical protein SCP_0412830 [Sparassis crispa]